MATLIQPKTTTEINRLGLKQLKDYIGKITLDYEKILNNEMLLCPMCGEWMKADTAFYLDRRYATSRYPICRLDIIAMVEKRNGKDDKSKPNETKESVQRVLHMMDRVYDDQFYEDCVKAAIDEAKEKNRNSPFATYFTALQSLPQYRGKTWKDSKFGESLDSVDQEQIKINQKTLKNSKKRFGYGYSDEDYMFLENEYQDWITRYECNTKAQEEVFENLSIIKLLKKKALKDGKSTKDLDKQQQDWLDTGNLKPKQNSMDTMSDAQTFGTFIQKVEETRPCADIDPELKDVDKIGLMIDVFFRGHTSKMLGLKNTFSHIYEKFMSKYTVNRPQYDAEEDSEIIFEKVFGSSLDDE